MELDHVFIRASVGAPEAALLRAIGLSEGSANTHPGQGTENRRFFFRNAFIELLWIADEAAVASAATRRTQLHERLGGAPKDASPFGICFRPSPGETAVPFAAWEYTPLYLPPGMKVDVAVDAPLVEPMWFFLARATAPEAALAANRQPLDHASGVGAISAISITVPGAHAWSAAAQTAMETGEVTVARGDCHLLEVEFDRGRTGRSHDFRPALPVVFRY